MTIIRSPRVQRDFTIISNSVCLDPRLSMRALGLLVRLLCRPDNWRTNSETLAREFDVGREQMRGVLRELSEAGYMRLVKARDDKGQWATHWAVFDSPQDAPKTDAPEDEKPAPGNPYVGGLGPITRTDLPRTEKNTPQPPKGESVSAGFAEFWALYPKKVGKDAAMSAWKRKVKGDHMEVIDALKTQKTQEAWVKEGGRFVPNPATWLNQGRWKDEVGQGGECSAVADWKRGAV